MTRPALGAAGNTPAAPMSGTRQVDAASHNRRGSQGKAGSSTTDHQPPAASGGITAPQHGGLNLLLLALLIALGLAALWLVLSRLRSQPEAAAGETARRRTEAETFRNALSPGRLRGGAEALASAIGLAALLRSASARRGVGRARATRKRSTRLEDAPPAPRAPRAQDAPAVPLTQNKPAALPAQTEPAVPAADTGAALAAGVEAFELGAALAEKGDVTGAEAAYRRADERGHASAASNLGVLLEQRGDLAGAEAAYRRADERGDATGAFNLARCSRTATTLSVPKRPYDEPTSAETPQGHSTSGRYWKHAAISSPPRRRSAVQTSGIIPLRLRTWACCSSTEASWIVRKPLTGGRTRAGMLSAPSSSARSSRSETICRAQKLLTPGPPSAARATWRSSQMRR